MNVCCFSSSVGHSFRSGSGSVSREAVRSQNVTQAAIVEGLMEDWKGRFQVGSLLWLSASTGSYPEASVPCHMALFVVLFEHPPTMASFLEPPKRTKLKQPYLS